MLEETYYPTIEISSDLETKISTIVGPKEADINLKELINTVFPSEETLIKAPSVMSKLLSNIKCLFLIK